MQFRFFKLIHFTSGRENFLFQSENLMSEPEKVNNFHF